MVLDDQPQKVFKVLSVDGGGIKGIYSARILERLESRFNCQIADYFDLICGTSTGGLIALALSLKIPASVITNFYQGKGEVIFQEKRRKSSWRQLFISSKHDNQELRKSLTEIFGQRTISDSYCLLCIPAFSLTNGRPFIFKYDHLEGNLVRDNKTKYVDIALATSAAPTYLPIVTIPDYDNRQFIDGGIYANNPTLVGVAEALKYFVGAGKQFTSLMVLSVASLETIPGRCLRTKEDRSIASWGSELIQTFFEGQAYFNEYVVQTLADSYNPPFEYLRIPSVHLSAEQSQLISLDNSSKSALNIMLAHGNDQADFYMKKSELIRFFQQKKQYIIR